MKKLCLLTLGISFAASLWAFDIKPGRWEIEAIIETDGKTINPQVEFKKAVAKMSPAQRKQFEDQMTKAAANHQTELNKNGATEVCYSKELLKDPGSLAPKDKNCSVNYTEKSAKKIKGTFSCQDKMGGTMEWTAISTTQYEGMVSGTDPKGKASKITYKGKFVSPNCGKLNPLIAK